MKRPYAGSCSIVAKPLRKAPIQFLSPDCLLLIFGFIDFTLWQWAMLKTVCQDWCDASMTSSWLGLLQPVVIRGDQFRGLCSLSMLQFLSFGTGYDELTDVGMLNLCRFSLLRSLSLRGCRSLTNRGLLALGALTNLSDLSLQSCDQITDQGMQCVAVLSRLCILDLSECVQITDRGLRDLRSLSNLRELNVSGCREITSEGFDYLTCALQKLQASLSNLTLPTYCMSSLTYLDLWNCPFELAYLSSLSSLRWLNLARCRSMSLDLGSLTSLQALEYLDLTSTWLNLMNLACLTSLQTLILANCIRIQKGDLDHLSGLSNLCYLDLTSCDESVTFDLSMLTSLQELSLQNCRVSNHHIESFASLPRLRRLVLTECRAILLSEWIAHPWRFEFSALETLYLYFSCWEKRDLGLLFGAIPTLCTVYSQDIKFQLTLFSRSSVPELLRPSSPPHLTDQDRDIQNRDVQNVTYHVSIPLMEDLYYEGEDEDLKLPELEQEVFDEQVEQKMLDEQMEQEMLDKQVEQEMLDEQVEQEMLEEQTETEVVEWELHEAEFLKYASALHDNQLQHATHSGTSWRR